MVPTSLSNYYPYYSKAYLGFKKAFFSIQPSDEGLTWNKRAGLQLSDDVAQLSLKVSSTGILEGLQHVLSINRTITLSIKLGKGLQDKRGKKISYGFHILKNWHFLRPVIFIAVVVGRVQIYHSKNK